MKKKTKNNRPIEPPKNQDVYPVGHIIKIKIKNSDRKLDEFHLSVFLLNHFNAEISPVHPIYIKPIHGAATRRGNTIDREVTGLQIAIKSQDPTAASTILANIAIETYPDHLSILIVAGNTLSEYWEKVTIIAKEIIPNLEEEGFEIGKVEPASLLRQSSLHPWEQIPDHYDDRIILELWWSHHSYKEIGLAVNKSDTTVANVLSGLRKRYGTDIVPTNDQRRRKRGNEN